MSDPGLHLSDLRLRVEATFDWPRRDGGSDFRSIPEVADELGRHLHSFQQNLATPGDSSTLSIHSAPLDVLVSGPDLDVDALERQDERVAKLERTCDELRRANEEMQESMEVLASHLDEGAACLERVARIEVQLRELDDRQRGFELEVNVRVESLDAAGAGALTASSATSEALTGLAKALAVEQVRIDSLQIDSLQLSSDLSVREEEASNDSERRDLERRELVSQVEELEVRLGSIEQRLADSFRLRASDQSSPAASADADVAQLADSREISAQGPDPDGQPGESEPPMALEAREQATVVKLTLLPSPGEAPKGTAGDDIIAADRETDSDGRDEQDLLDPQLTEIVLRNLRGDGFASEARQSGTPTGPPEGEDYADAYAQGSDLEDPLDTEDPGSALDILRGEPEDEHPGPGGRFLKRIRR